MTCFVKSLPRPSPLPKGEGLFTEALAIDRGGDTPRVEACGRTRSA